jgi:hypothetical protein
MINKRTSPIRIAANDLHELRELQRKIRKAYPYISEIQVERQAWKAYLKQKQLWQEKQDGSAPKKQLRN